MRQTIETIATAQHVPVSVKAGNVFSWQAVLAVVLKLKNRLPEPLQDVIPIENVADLKMVIKLFAILLGAFLMGGIYDMLLLEEGGAL